MALYFYCVILKYLKIYDIGVIDTMTDTKPFSNNSINTSHHHEAWPPLPYKEFAPSLYFLHRLVQMVGKLKLTTPFEPHWANVALWLTSHGLSSGAIPYKTGIFTVSINFKEHELHFDSSWGKKAKLEILPCSIADLHNNFLKCLQDLKLDLPINPNPQEIPNAIAFNLDKEPRPYDRKLVGAWWQILLSSYRVLERYHARFAGISPAVGLMWGTLDLRDARYRNIPVDMSKAGFIERNAMDVHQVEAGWWAGSEKYERPAYFSFTYPQPAGIENGQIKPDSASWNKNLGEFILDYDLVRNSQDPDNLLLSFFESGYAVGAELAGWDPKLLTEGKPR